MARHCNAPPDRSIRPFPPFTFRLEDDLRDALAEDAAANGRTVAGTIRYHLRRALGMAA